jgi:transcription elongation factor Elf1
MSSPNYKCPKCGNPDALLAVDKDGEPIELFCDQCNTITKLRDTPKSAYGAPSSV